MKMTFKKECKHSVVYETQDEKAAVKSVYVQKDWLTSPWPKEIYLVVEVEPFKVTPS